VTSTLPASICRSNEFPMIFAADTSPLLIDRSAAAMRPDEAAVHEWAREQRVFVSSVIEGYGSYRDAAITAIENVGAEPIAFERFGGRESPAEEAYLSEVRASTVYIGLLGARYGRPLQDRYSATHSEFLEAERNGIRTSVWAQQAVEREGPQQSFVDAVQTFQVTGSYTSPEDLTRSLEQRLKTIAGEDLSPWVKLGNVLFRASEIQEESGSATVTATVRDPAVVSALRALENRMHGRRQSFSYADRVLVAEPRRVSATTRASRAVELTIQLGVAPTPQPTRMSVNGVSWEQLTEMSVAVSLFGEPNPMGLMAHSVQITNPLPGLQAAGVPEEALRPIVRLALSEALVTERGIERLTVFSFGSPVHGRRLLKLGWLAPAPYTGQPPLVSDVEGQINW
jgi:hypothetical protein